MYREKIDFISVAKGIGIILVVMGHCLTGKITNFIYLFHMPLFFMISGYLFNGPCEDIKKYIFNKVKKLYIPYVICNFAFLIFHNLFFDIGFYKDGVLQLHKINNFYFIKETIGIMLLTHMEQVVAPSWYLRVCLFGIILYMVIRKYLVKGERQHYLLITCIYIIIFCAFYSNIIKGSILTYLTLVLMSLVFITWGEVYNKYEYLIKYKFLYIVLCVLVLLFLNNLGSVNIVAIHFENPFFLIITSFLGMYTVLGISKFLERTKMVKIFKYIGDHSLIILLLHCFIFKLVNIFCAFFYSDKSILYTIAYSENILWSFIYILAGIVLPLIIEFEVKKIYKYIKKWIFVSY